MKCSKCGAECIEGINFCPKCGNSLELQTNLNVSSEPISNLNNNNIVSNLESQNSNLNQQVSLNQNIITPNIDVQIQTNNMSNNTQQINQTVVNAQPTNQNINTNNTNNKNNNFNVFNFIFNMIIKPMKTFEENDENLKQPKNSIILAIITTALILIINMFTTIKSVVYTKSYNFFGGGYETTWNWDALGDINYLKLIGGSILSSAIVIFGIAGIYYVASLIAKKTSNYFKLVSLVAVSFLPAIICSSILSPLLSMMIAQIGPIISAIGLIYTISILVCGINNEIKFDKKDSMIYFHLICLSLVVIICIIFVYQSIDSAISSSSGIYSQLNSSLFD